MASEAEIRQIKDKIDIVEYIGRAVQLKKAGRNFSGLCPFHGENSPSFNVSPDRQIFKCFGCGVSGDLFTFVMQHDGLSFPEAIKMLADEAGVEIQKVESPQSRAASDLKERLYEMHDAATAYYHFLLTKHEVGEESREYFQNRGIDTASEVVTLFHLGYSAKSWDGLGEFLKKKGFTTEEIIAGGLGVKSPSTNTQGLGFYDMFRGRVMFPLYDKAGHVVGFAGRVLGVDKTAKYINSAETAIFHKREFLFGYFQAKEYIRKKGEVILVEGEMDMLSSFQAGVKNVCAVKGSALTEEQITLLGKICNRLLLCFDADKAGDMAMRKAILLAEDRKMEIKIVQVKNGKDPDEAIRKGVQNWIESVENAIPYYDFIIQSALKRYDVKNAIGKRDIIQEVLPQLRSIKDIIIQSHYLQKLSTYLGISEQELAKVTQTVSSPPKTATPMTPVNRVPLPKKVSLEELVNRAKRKADDRYAVDYLTKKGRTEWYFMALLLRLHQQVESIEKKLHIEEIDDKKVKEVYTHFVDFFAAKPNSFIQDFIANAGSDIIPIIDEIFLIDIEPEGDEALRSEIFLTIKNLKEMSIREEMRVISLEMKQLELTGNAEEISQLQERAGMLVMRLGKLQKL
ncbi:MAG: DNA primase [bacterium]|nr:DNA primase [bacterium]